MAAGCRQRQPKSQLSAEWKCVQVVPIDIGGSAMPSPKACRKRGSGTYDWLTGLPPVNHLPTLPPMIAASPGSSRWRPARRANRHPIASQIAVIELSLMQMGGKLCHSAPASGLFARRVVSSAVFDQCNHFDRPPQKSTVKSPHFAHRRWSHRWRSWAHFFLFRENFSLACFLRGL
jgi:hypothetical protein